MGLSFFPFWFEHEDQVSDIGPQRQAELFQKSHRNKGRIFLPRFFLLFQNRLKLAFDFSISILATVVVWLARLAYISIYSSIYWNLSVKPGQPCQIYVFILYFVISAAVVKGLFCLYNLSGMCQTWSYTNEYLILSAPDYQT